MARKAKTAAPDVSADTAIEEMLRTRKCSALVRLTNRPDLIVALNRETLQKPSGVEKRIQARVAFLLLKSEGLNKDGARQAIAKHFYPGAASNVAALIASGGAGGPVNEPARARFDAMTDEERSAMVKDLQPLIF